MKTIRFHVDLYGGPALDEAMKVYEPFASFARSEEPPYWVVAITADNAARERSVAGELANYALGLTVKQRRHQDGPPSSLPPSSAAARRLHGRTG